MMSTYTNTHFISGFCNGNGSKHAVVEYQNVTYVTEHLKPYAEVGETDFFSKANVFEGLLTAVLQTFLDNELPPSLEDRPFTTQVQMWLQHDRAPPDFGREVTKFLDENYKGWPA
jgi:hypothetical protein